MKELRSSMIQSTYDADVVIEEGNCIYLCYVDVSKADKNLALEAQNIWRICQIKVQGDDENKITTRKWAKGSKLFQFNIVDRPTDFKFA